MTDMGSHEISPDGEPEGTPQGEDAGQAGDLHPGTAAHDREHIPASENPKDQ